MHPPTVNACRRSPGQPQRWTLLCQSAELAFLCAAAWLNLLILEDVLDLQRLAYEPENLQLTAVSLVIYLFLAGGLAAIYGLLALPLAYARRVVPAGAAGRHLPAKPVLIDSLQAVGRRVGVAAVFVVTLTCAYYAFPRGWVVFIAALSIAWGVLERMSARQDIEVFALAEGPMPAGPARRVLTQFARDHGAEDVELRRFVARPGPQCPWALCGRPGGRPTVWLAARAIDTLRPRDLLAVFAHELAHLRRGTNRSLWVAGAVKWIVPPAVAALLLSAADPSLPRVWQVLRDWPIIVMAIWLIDHVVLRPIVLALSRHDELVADRVALEMTEDPCGFIAAMTRLAQADGQTGRGNWLSGMLTAAHPSLPAICRVARRYARRHNMSLEEPPPYMPDQPEPAGPDELVHAAGPEVEDAPASDGTGEPSADAETANPGTAGRTPTDPPGPRPTVDPPDGREDAAPRGPASPLGPTGRGGATGFPTKGASRE